MILGWLLCAFIAESINPGKLKSADLREDVAILRKALEKYHPGLFWYTSKAEFDTSWDRLGAQLDTDMTDDQFFKLLLPVVSRVQCAHTFFYPSNIMSSRGTRFPLNLKFLNKKVYILSDFSTKSSIPVGSELLTINGKSIQELVDLLLPNLQAQGGNIGWKYVILESDFHNYYYYVIGQPETFQIEYIDHVTQQKASVSVNGNPDEALRKYWKNWYPIEDGPPLNFRYDSDRNAGILTVKSFTKGRYEFYHQDFDQLLDQYFTEVRREGIKRLVIDLRGNEGGNRPEKLFSYVALSEDKEKEAKNCFKGEVIVLTNERSISAMEKFVSMFKYHHRGLTIGQATPGSANGLCGGNKHKLVLPHSRLELSIPLHKTLFDNATGAAPKQGEGYPPDFTISETIDDFLQKKDRVMEAALGKFK